MELIIEGKIRSLHFAGQPAPLPVYEIDTFDINRAKSAGLVRLSAETCIAYSRWSSPKRTRTYPFARIYDTYSYGGKIVTIIPILKDEGAGERENDTNLDRINYITYSWMNLANIYIVLAWYVDAEKKDALRITNQRMDSEYVRCQMRKIAEYKFDAHHWNQEHFRNDFVPIYQRAIEAYHRISQDLGVAVHTLETHDSFLASVRDASAPKLLDIDLFREVTLRRSHLSAQHETVTQHQLESLSGSGVKALFQLTNYLGGVYYLTADEVFFASEDSLVIRECKNTSRSFLPAISDIKDGLFKLLLFSRLENVTIDGKPISTSVELRLTSTRLQENMSLPIDESRIDEYVQRHKIPPKTSKLLGWLNEESRRIGITVTIQGAGTGDG